MVPTASLSQAPTLVERCREFAETLPGAGLDYWCRIGIAASITPKVVD